MNNSKKNNTILITLIVLVVVVWSFALAGLAKAFLGGVHNLKRDGSENRQNQISEPSPSDLLQSPDVNIPEHVQEEFDISGTWDMNFYRYYSAGYEDSWESIGTEEVSLWLEIYPGEQFEYDIMPVEAYINGEQYTDSLALEPQLYTGEVVGDTLKLYFDIDNFYLDYNTEVVDTIEPGYIEIPLTLQNGKLCGNYEYTWVVNIEGYDMQSRVTFEVTKR